MAYRGESLRRCPDCAKRGVSLRLGSEDTYGCRYCGWSIFSNGRDPQDTTGRVDLDSMNPDREPIADDLDRSLAAQTRNSA